MQMPTICARCGQSEGTTTWNVKGTVSTREERLGVSALLCLLTHRSDRVRRESYCFSAPVCEACRRPLLIERVLTIVLRLAGLIGGGLGLGLSCNRLDPNDEYFGPFVWIITGLLGCLGGGLAALLSAWIIDFITHSNLASFTGLHSPFRNSEFYRQFAALDSAWVKP